MKLILLLLTYSKDNVVIMLLESTVFIQESLGLKTVRVRKNFRVVSDVIYVWEYTTSSRNQVLVVCCPDVFMGVVR